jgi:hypothetical protein
VFSQKKLVAMTIEVDRNVILKLPSLPLLSFGVMIIIIVIIIITIRFAF